MARFWANLDAPRWVYRLGVLQTALLCLLTGLTALFALPLGPSPFAIVILAVLAAVAAFCAWSTSAWRRGRPWAWWMWAVVSVLGVAFALIGLLVRGSSWSDWYSLVTCGGTLVLLGHPANRNRLIGPVEPLPVNAHPADLSFHS
jgi:hypothetical protein